MATVRSLTRLRRAASLAEAGAFSAVPGWAAGASFSDYYASGKSLVSGAPAGSPTIHAATSSFNLVWDVSPTRGSRFGSIQNNTQSAWKVAASLGIKSITFSSFSSTIGNTRHSFTMEVVANDASYTGVARSTGSNYFYSSGIFDCRYTGTYTANGTVSAMVRLMWLPDDPADNYGFNPRSPNDESSAYSPFSGSPWNVHDMSFTMYETVPTGGLTSAFEFKWFHSQTDCDNDTNVQGTGSTYTRNVGQLAIGASTQLWARTRPTGGSWTKWVWTYTRTAGSPTGFPDTNVSASTY